MSLQGVTRCAVALPIVFLAFASSVFAESKAQTTAEPVIAVFRLNGSITETPTPDDFPFATAPSQSLKTLIAHMQKARDDKAVKAVVLLLGNLTVGSAQVEEIRKALNQLKQAGKKVYAHADSLTMRSYVLLSGASQLSVVPTGDIWTTGLYGESPYLRGLLDKLGIQPDYLTCGAYKSAAEIFMRTGPSPEAEKMTNWLVDSQFQTDLTLIATGRNVPEKRVRDWIDAGPYTAEKALKLGMIDAVQFREEFVETLKAEYGAKVKLNTRYGKKKSPTVDLSSPFGIFALWAELLQGTAKRTPTKDAVAIVYVDGPILSGRSDNNPFGSTGIAYSTPIRKALDRVADDSTVKAVVLRVNSPGGSAVASEIILNAAERVKKKKPFVVSMGDVAGSGGYYVACGADTIFADASTITGSIGVVAGKFATNNMWKKVGIDWHAVQRGNHSGLLSSADVFSDEERQTLQKWMNEIYAVFKNHVVSYRGDRLTKEIDDIAGGRVYTGEQALKLGLIDRLGGLDDAIHDVAQQAKLEDYDIRIVPRPKNFLEVLFGDLTEQEDEDGTISLSSRLTSPVSADSLVQRALPLLKGFDWQRVNAIRMALQRLDWLQREHVLLVMPEILIHP